jgi:hypothetical protein
MPLEKITIRTSRKDESREILFEAKNVSLKLDFYWNAHGKRINWNKNVKVQKNYSKVDIKVERYVFTQVFESIEDTTFETLQLFVNGKLVEGDVVKWTWWEDDNGVPERYNIKLDCGWG